ncbi:MAG: hypothetical protein JW841_10560 [Deltaproteobacteria bacterium]|nr:hypothetical protein [Deltaproteobacteria bacterium]
MKSAVTRCNKYLSLPICKSIYKIFYFSLCCSTIFFISCGDNKDNQNIENNNECNGVNAITVETIILKDYGFQPNCIQVHAGSQLSFFNKDSKPNIITTTLNSDDSFTSTLIPAGSIYTRIFNTVGITNLTSQYYTVMHATVIVEQFPLEVSVTRHDRP